MTSTMFELVVFNGKKDFSIGQQKRGDFVKQKISKAITQEYPTIMTIDQRNKVDERAYTLIILHLFNQVLGKVEKLDTAKALWDKLEELYLVKSLPNKLFLMERLFSFKIDSSNDLDDNLDTFNNLVQDIINTVDKVSNEYKAVVLLSAILEA